MKTIIVFSAILISCLAQRSPYAGSRPIGFPYVPPSTAAPDSSGLGNRLSDEPGTTTTMRLPLEALGNAELVQRMSKLPIDHQPFWLINWRVLEENRNNPRSYSQRSNSFVDNINFNSMLSRR